MASTMVSLRIDNELLERIERAAGPRQRARWIIAACERGLTVSTVQASGQKPPEGITSGYVTLPSAGRVPHLPRCSCAVCKPAKPS